MSTHFRSSVPCLHLSLSPMFETSILASLFLKQSMRGDSTLSSSHSCDCACPNSRCLLFGWKIAFRFFRCTVHILGLHHSAAFCGRSDADRFFPDSVERRSAFAPCMLRTWFSALERRLLETSLVCGGDPSCSSFQSPHQQTLRSFSLTKR